MPKTNPLRTPTIACLKILLTALALVVWLPLSVGCDMGTYNQRLQEHGAESTDSSDATAASNNADDE